MPDILDANGLQVDTAAEITSDLVAGLQQIYGADINVDQNSSDGEEVGLVTQMAVDIRELIVNVNSGFDPDQAVGAILDQRVTLNNIQRQGGTYTIQPIDIVVASGTTINLQGLDANFNSPTGTGYTIQDSNGNQFILIDSATFTTGTTTVDFRAQQIGDVNVPINTINVPVTIVPGVTSVNNSSSALSVGQDQETDAQLRARRQISASIVSQGYLNGLEGALANLSGVTDSKVYENRTDSTDGNGIPPHAIWVIAEGGANSDIANLIYIKKDPGANMKGSVSVNITTVSGSTFVAKFDRPTAHNLWIAFTIKTTISGYSFDTASIAAYMAEKLIYGIGDYAETSLPTDAAQGGIANQGGGGVPVLMTVSSDGISYTDFIASPTLDSQWTLDPSRITITVI